MTELRARKLLVPYLVIADRAGRLQHFGVSGYSLEDALALLNVVGIPIDPSDPAITIREHPQFTDWEAKHIGPNMGPAQFRGVWYPPTNL